MLDIDKHAKKGLLVFAACAVIIILTGIVFIAVDMYATGPVRSGRTGPVSVKTLDGYQIIWVGVIMLILELLMLVGFIKKRRV